MGIRVLSTLITTGTTETVINDITTTGLTIIGGNVTAPSFIGNLTGTSTSSLNSTCLNGVASACYMRKDSPNIVNTYINVTDGQGLNAGTGCDFQYWHSGTNSFIDNCTGGIFIRNNVSDNIYLQPIIGENGIIVSPNADVKLYYDNSLKFYTTTSGVEIAGAARLNDNNRLEFGTGNDMNIWHDGTNSLMKNYTGHLILINGSGGDVRIQAVDGENSIVAYPNGSTSLFYDNNERLTTVGQGVETYGLFKQGQYYIGNSDAANPRWAKIFTITASQAYTTVNLTFNVITRYNNSVVRLKATQGDRSSSFWGDYRLYSNTNYNAIPASDLVVTRIDDNTLEIWGIAPVYSNISISDYVETNTGAFSVTIHQGVYGTPTTPGDYSLRYDFENGVLLSPTLGLKASTQTYGTVETIGSNSSWAGYVTNGINFMSDGNGGGFFNDTNDQWMLLTCKGGTTELYYNGAAKLCTTSTGINIPAGGIDITGQGNTHINYQNTGCHYISGCYLYLRDNGSAVKTTINLLNGNISTDGCVSVTAPNGSGQIKWNGVTGLQGFTYSDSGGVGITDADPYQELIYLYPGLNRIVFYTAGNTRGYFDSNGLNVSSTVCAATVCATTSFVTTGAGLRFCGGTGCGCAVDWIASSDCRQKKCIEPYNNGLEKVNRLNPVYYNWIDEENTDKDMGFIAQEVLNIEPTLVSGSEETGYGLKYDKFSALMVKAMQELSTCIDQLKLEINSLKNK